MDEDINYEYCELVDKKIPLSHKFFEYESHIRITQSFLGLAVSEAKNTEKIRKMLDILDTLNQNLYDSDTVLPDMVRKELRREDKEWIDIGQKMDAGDTYTAYLIAAAANLRMALSCLSELKEDSDFKSHITDYALEFMIKLANMINNEALGNVLL
ncbi:MAG: DUF1940 domain-containing protein [Ferroplasma sp.]